ncbi:hypothetical protein PVK06_006446 [Gossypium arboreum]|uniref:Uncharacterized protein n=1 Tax=Gossypium arboreum TaxID=29729 RepID=A0ABR0QER1_GOSAR|nr:hypothetical protein PVK06_006446 [Gossypium arboreum]
MASEDGCWIWELFADHQLDHSTILKVTAIRPPNKVAGRDICMDKFSMTEAYKAIVKDSWSPSNDLWQKIWKLKCPQRIKHLWPVFDRKSHDGHSMGAVKGVEQRAFAGGVIRDRHSNWIKGYYRQWIVCLFLVAFGISVDTCCFLCMDATERGDHNFSESGSSRNVWQSVLCLYSIHRAAGT